MREISRGNVDYEKIVIGQFIACIPKDLDNLQKALDQHDLDRLSSVAHNMKTSVGIMGLNPVLESHLDKLEESDTGAVDLQNCIHAIQDICNHAVREAKEVYSKLKS
jgi:HPt (histidine-containing phosphotransfer) domain-containing protein